MSRFAHLPPGHPPGPQSRRVARGRPWAPILVVLFGLGAVGAAVALWVGRNTAKSKSGSEVGAAVFLGVAILLVLLAVWLWRRLFHPRVARWLEVRADPVAVRRGDTVRATLRVTDPSRVDGNLQLGLVCTAFHDVKVHSTDAQGHSSDHRSTQRSDVVKDWRELDTGTAEHALEFTVPAGAAFSYEGDTISWAWRVSARVERGHRSDPHSDVPIWVAP